MADMAPHEVRLKVQELLQARGDELRQKAARLDLAASELTHGHPQMALEFLRERGVMLAMTQLDLVQLTLVNDLYDSLSQSA
jgi:hypothetical protein